MTKKEKIKALNIMLDNMYRVNFDECWGLCAVADRLCGIENILSAREYDYIIGIIENEHSAKRVGTEGYLWKIGSKPPRIKFLKNHLRELKK